MNNNSRIISHHEKDKNLENTKNILKKKILKNNDTRFASVEEQLDLLEKLEQFEFGKFLIKSNGGWNGYWTHYALTFPEKGRLINKSNDGTDLTELESFILNKATIILATQQRFKIFLKENNTCVKEGACLASAPCGLLGELLFLDYKSVRNISLFGIDLDENSLIEADKLSVELGFKKYTKTILSDAWELSYNNKFDLLSSNGLNIYEPDKNKVLKLYISFFDCLKKNGKLVTSYLGYPPNSEEVCEWDLEKVNLENMRKCSAIFGSILGGVWFNFTTRNQMINMLTSIGYKDIEIKYDNAHIFPTVVAYKR
ncbi:MAG: methyltransferase domain-containing protein [bacterium]|nr:methyltransferase domain-containing protein [bacterium]